ncbi:hypothetical protein [Mesobacillus zeae]|uniref:Uncharacterized protein n=1 Tax=Mesobacillus zeae TaxID=1917180 RepID=A0A398AZZ3_9BACI|nr:hypothetical protein [Mesobacillus zeae]RID83229.1 hypothetical protein D1970_17090 [Mesobacillus zeae]
MIDHIEIIKRLEQQNALIDTTEAQREANLFRIQWLTWLHRDKPTYHPSNGTDFLLEAHKNPNYRCTPRSLLEN